MAKTGRADRTRDGDEALIQAVYREHGRAMLAYATRLLGDRAAAEDVVQEALIRAWRHPEVLTNGKGSIRGWLLTVIRNLVTDRHRARAARPAEVAESDATPAVERDHADRVVASVTVLEALEGLSEDHRGVLDQLYFQGRSLGETASVLGIPTGTVKSRTYYALAGVAPFVEPGRGAQRERGERGRCDGMNGPTVPPGMPPEGGPYASGDPGSPHRGPQEHDPGELGALALGLLDPQRTRAVEEHLARCAACRRDLEDLTAVTDLLGEVPPEALLDGPPDGDLVLQRTLRQIRAEAAADRGDGSSPASSRPRPPWPCSPAAASPSAGSRRRSPSSSPHPPAWRPAR